MLATVQKRKSGRRVGRRRRKRRECNVLAKSGVGGFLSIMCLELSMPQPCHASCFIAILRCVPANLTYLPILQSRFNLLYSQQRLSPMSERRERSSIKQASSFLPCHSTSPLHCICNLLPSKGNFSKLYIILFSFFPTSVQIQIFQKYFFQLLKLLYGYQRALVTTLVGS